LDRRVRGSSASWRGGTGRLALYIVAYGSILQDTMKTVTIDERRIAARIKVVDEHVRAENAHELDATMATFNEAPDSKVNNDEFSGRESVRAFYADVFTGFPDLHLEVTQRYVSAREKNLTATCGNRSNPHPGGNAPAWIKAH
jgi:SnoaL-like domain